MKKKLVGSSEADMRKPARSARSILGQVMEAVLGLMWLAESGYDMRGFGD
jgi:hypothetical protein